MLKEQFLDARLAWVLAALCCLALPLPGKAQPPAEHGDTAIRGDLCVAKQVGNDDECDLATAPLEVRRYDTTDGILLRLVNEGDVKIMFEDTSTVNGYDWIWAISDGDFRITRVYSGATEFEMDVNGNLSILGDYISNGTTLEVPDFVFESDYSLMPIEELASFVQQNRHLPGVPSADEVRTGDGLNISQFQMKLLEKVEELTLYTLNQQATIEELRSTIAELREQLTPDRTESGLQEE